MSTVRRSLALTLVLSTGTSLALAQPASAFNPIKVGCTVAGAVNPTAKKACTALKIGLGAFGVIKGLFGGGSSSKPPTSSTSSTATTATTALGLAAIGTWVLGGATFALHETARVLSHTTAPQLDTTWFSSTYWRVAGIAALLTLPFLFAAAVQALIRSDVTLLLRAVLGYLPLAILAVAIAAPLTMLLLAASDQLASAVSSASGDASAHLLRVVGITIVALTALSRSPFMVFFVGLLTVAAAVALWIELLVREAAVYVIVLMLPLVFSAMVWPARRVWAVRAVELLVALILSKFAIVAVLSLGGAAISHTQGHSISGLIAGVVLLGLGVFSPWALLRLIPLAELASSAAGSLRREVQTPAQEFGRAWAKAGQAESWATTTAAMRRDSERGLAVGHGRPVPTNSGVSADATGADPHQEPAPTEATGDPASEDLPIPEPGEPDLGAADHATEHPADPEPVATAVSSDTDIGRTPDLPDILRKPDLSQEVLLGPEGIGLPSRRRPPPRRFDPAPGQPAQPPSVLTDPPGDQHDPTPPPQTPPEGRL